MDGTEIRHKTIVAFCREYADEAIVIKYQRYFTDQYDAWGLDGALMRENYASWVKEWALTPDQTIALVDRLFAGRSEEIFFATWFLRDLKKELRSEHFALLRGWFDRYVKNWAHCDVIVSELVSVLFKNKVIGYKDFSAWRSSGNAHTRRAVPVSFIWIVKKDPAVDVQTLLGFIHPLINDTEKPVRQGLGWFLREAWKKHPGPVEAYLSEIKEYAPRLIIQYATEKMPKEQKDLYRRSK